MFLQQGANRKVLKDSFFTELSVMCRHNTSSSLEQSPKNQSEYSIVDYCLFL